MCRCHKTLSEYYMCWWSESPQPLDSRLVERVNVGRALHAVVVGQEAHARVEGRRVAGRLLAQQDLHRVRHGAAELVVEAARVHAAVGVHAVVQAVCGCAGGQRDRESQETC